MSVMDGIGAEKSLRWMAERIWGEARVASEWNSEIWTRAQVPRRIGNVPAIRANSGDMRGRELT